MQGICYIVGAGHFSETALELNENDYIIAADGGYNFLQKLGMHPDILLGDFDSIEDIPENIKKITFPSNKDDTDMALAVNLAIEKGYKNIVLMGALGGRTDHSYGNIALLVHMARLGIENRIVDGRRVITAVTDKAICFDETYSGYVSVFSADTRSYGVSIEGLKYELNNVMLTNDVTLGVSNEFIGKSSRISVEDGTLIIMYEK